MDARCCHRTKPNRKASTTWRACYRCRRRSWRTTCLPRERSAGVRSAIRRSLRLYYHGNPAVEIVTIGGPYGPLSRGDSPSSRKVFVCRPKDAAGEEPCANKILSTLASRASRRPATESDIQTLLGFYKAGRDQDSFNTGIQRGIERILAAPSFLFR